MENDRDANYSGNMNTSGKPYEDLRGSADTEQNLSFFKDDESKAWERRLMAPDMGLDPDALQMSKETRSFLWDAGMVRTRSRKIRATQLTAKTAAPARQAAAPIGQKAAVPVLPPAMLRTGLPGAAQPGTSLADPAPPVMRIPQTPAAGQAG